MPTAPPPVPSAKRIRRPATVWWLYLPAALAALIATTLYFDDTSQQTGAERGIEQSIAMLVLIISGLLLLVAAVISKFRPYLCAACGTKIQKTASHCPSCRTEVL